MWRNTYKDYQIDTLFLKEPVEPGHGITGCEMHELNGWGEGSPLPKKEKLGLIHTLLKCLFKKRENL